MTVVKAAIVNRVVVKQRQDVERGDKTWGRRRGRGAKEGGRGRQLAFAERRQGGVCVKEGGGGECMCNCARARENCSRPRARKLLAPARGLGPRRVRGSASVAPRQPSQYSESVTDGFSRTSVTEGNPARIPQSVTDGFSQSSVTEGNPASIPQSNLPTLSWLAY